jgi:hypothetical protein
MCLYTHTHTHTNVLARNGYAVVVNNVERIIQIAALCRMYGRDLLSCWHKWRFRFIIYFILILLNYLLFKV